MDVLCALHHCVLGIYPVASYSGVKKSPCIASDTMEYLSDDLLYIYRFQVHTVHIFSAHIVKVPGNGILYSGFRLYILAEFCCAIGDRHISEIEQLHCTLQWLRR